MTFLSPLVGLIALGLALPAIILLYLLKLRRRPLTVSSTFLWEQAARDAQVNVPLRWIPPSLLLLLHLLILLLFVAALARPAIPGVGGAQQHVYLLIDRSASMQARDARDAPTRFDAARAQALDLARQVLGTGGSTRISVLAFAHDAPAMSRPLSTLSDVRAALDSISLSDQPARLKPALELVEANVRQTTESDAHPEPPLVAIFSDGDTHDDTTLSIAGARVTFSPVPIDPARSANIGIIACSAVRDDVSPSVALVFVQIQSTFPQSRGLMLQLLVDDVLVAEHAVRLPAAGDEPGSFGQSFRVPLPGSGLITARLSADDALPIDDSASVFLAEPVRPRVLLVHPDDRNPNPFLLDALEALPLRSLRSMPRADYLRVAAEAPDALDLIILDSVPPALLSAVPTLTFGAALPGEAPGSSDRPGGPIIAWDRRSPLLRHVALDSIQINRWPGPPDAAELAAIARSTALASISQGDVIHLLDAPEARHVRIGFALDQSNWALHHSFPIFLFNAVEYLTDADRGRSSRSASTIEPVFVSTRTRSSNISLQGPRSASIARPPQAGIVSLGVLDRVGVYRAEDVEPQVIAVNLFNARESRLEPRPSLVIGGAEAPDIEQVQGLREIWAWFVAAAAALLIIEWFVYAQRVRL